MIEGGHDAYVTIYMIDSDSAKLSKPVCHSCAVKNGGTIYD